MAVLFVLLGLLYGGLGVFAWWFGRQNARRPYPLKGELLLLAALLPAHAAAVWQPLLLSRFPNGIGYALCLITWLMLLLYWCGSFFYPLKGLQLLLYPFAALSMLAAAQWPAPGADYAVDNMPFALHVGASVLSYSLFGIAALLALLVLLLNRCLRNHRISPLISFLPPLLSLEKLMFQSMLAGFVLLSISVGGALLFPLEIFGKPLALTHKSVFGVLSWLVYAGILLLHRTRRWRGHTAALWCVAGFVCLMLAYVGSKFVLQVLLHRV